MAQPGLDPVFKLLRQKLALMFEYLLENISPLIHATARANNYISTLRHIKRYVWYMQYSGKIVAPFIKCPVDGSLSSHICSHNKVPFFSMYVVGSQIFPVPITPALLVGSSRL